MPRNLEAFCHGCFDMFPRTSKEMEARPGKKTKNKAIMMI